jgi:hemerythrin superfamily protein
MNLYIMLHQDHEKAKNLLEQLEASGEDEEGRRERLFATLFRELESHAEAEERYFYSRLKINDQARGTVLESLGDHKDIKKLLGELDAMDKGTPGWTRKCRTLREEVEAHILAEEEELFPLAQKVIEDEEAAGIAEDIETLKEARAEVEFW